MLLLRVTQQKTGSNGSTRARKTWQYSKCLTETDNEGTL